MKIYHDVLPKPLLKECVDEVLELMKERCWGSSMIRWHPTLKKGVVGDSVHTYVPEETKNKIIESIKEYFPQDSTYDMHYFVWLPNSGISEHNDGEHSYGATIYLNRAWDKNMGGIFLWDDGDPVVMKAISPKFNMMVANDCHQTHMVTPVSPLATGPRFTIQIWVDS